MLESIIIITSIPPSKLPSSQDDNSHHDSYQSQQNDTQPSSNGGWDNDCHSGISIAWVIVLGANENEHVLYVLIFIKIVPLSLLYLHDLFSLLSFNFPIISNFMRKYVHIVKIDNTTIK